jgi:hypothetical protein
MDKDGIGSEGSRRAVALEEKVYITVVAIKLLTE